MRTRDYAKLKQKVIESRKVGANDFKRGKKCLDQAKESTKRLGGVVENISKASKTLTTISTKFYKAYYVLVDLIIERQDRLTKAKRSKDTRAVTELKNQIAILDKDARKLRDRYVADTKFAEGMSEDIQLIQKGLARI